MLRDYELMYIVRPDLDDDAVKTAMDSVQSIVEANGGEVVKTTPWGKRRLAYEIQKLRDGHYVLLEVRLDGTRVKEVERTLRIHDQVFRHMVVTLDHAAEGADGAGEPGGDVAAAVESTAESTEQGAPAAVAQPAEPVAEAEAEAEAVADAGDAGDDSDEADAVDALDDDEEDS